MSENEEGKKVLSLPSPKIPIYRLEKMGIGRPTIFTPELMDKICHELSQGKSMRTVCKDPDMPDPATIFRWLRTNEEFCKQYARAKEESADAMSEEILDISDGAVNLAVEVDPKASGAVVQAARLQVDTRKWLMSKMKPKRYADKLDLSSGGEVIKGNTINFNSFTLNATNG